MKQKVYDISEEDKRIIDDFLEKYSDEPYFRDNFFNGEDPTDILEYVTENDCYVYFGDDLLDEFDDDELIDYMQDAGYLVQEKDDAINLADGSIENQKLLINTVCRNITKRYLTKEDKKKEINEFIDVWF